MGSKYSVLEGAQCEYDAKPIHRVFEQNLNSCATERALIYDDPVEGVRETSFETLNKNSNRLAASILKHLKDINAQPNQDGDYIIAVCMTVNDYVATTLLSIWKAGAAYLPIEPTFPKNRVEHIVGEAKPVLVIYDQYDDLSAFGDANTIMFSELMSKSVGCMESNIDPEQTLCQKDEDIAIILYTSGSTGTPKGVRLPHSAILNKLLWLRQTFPYSETEKVAVLTSNLINVDSVAELWGPLINRVAVLVISQKLTRDPSQLVAVLDTYKVERIVLVPTILEMILLHVQLKSEKVLSSLKMWICCGETLTTLLAQKFFNYFNGGTHILCNFYGSTEDMGDVTYYVCKNMDQLNGLNKVPIGCPLQNTVIFITDDNITPVKEGEIGEILVAGLNLAKGYVNGREKSKFILNRFTDNPKYDRLYKTGDFGKIVNGVIHCEGRRDTQMKVRGNRVDLIEVEKVVQSIEDVDKAAVLCYKSGEKDQALLAFVTLKNKDRYRRGTQLENILKEKLIDYQLPHVLIIDAFPLLENKKVDRQALLRIYVKRSKEDIFDYTGIPEDKLEIAKGVFETISEVIGKSIRSKISVTSNFYELGGDSLNSVFTVTQLRNKGYFIGITDFITAKCLGDLLNKIIRDGKETLLDDKNQLGILPLTDHHKNQAISILTSSFYEKSDLEIYLKAHIQYTNYKDVVEQVWGNVLEKNISYAVTDSANNIVGIALNFDAADEPKFSVNSRGQIIFELLDSIEGPIKEKQLPRGLNKVFHSLFMATSAKLTPQENVAVIQKMEHQNILLAKQRGFTGVLASNSSPLTQQLANVLGYQTMNDYQINLYIHKDGSRPFDKAPDSQRVIVHWKDITMN